MSEVLENKSKKKSDLSKEEGKVKKVDSSKSEELNTEKTKSKTGNKTSNKPQSVKKVKENGNVTVKETAKKTVKESTKQTPTQKTSTDRKITSKPETGETSNNKVTSNKSSVNKTTNTRKTLSSKASTNKTDTNKISANKVSTNKTKPESKINSNAKIEKDKLKKVDDKQKNELKSTTKSKQQKNNTNQKNKEKVEETKSNLPAPESKFDTVSLKEIREALQNKVNDNQKQKVVKKVLLNIGFAITMIVYLIIVAVATKNIEVSVSEKYLKIITLGILVLGIGLLERAYKKDNTQMAINAVEILIFGAINLCMIYAIKINFIKLGDFKDVINNITYISSVVAVYYIIKSIIISVKSVRKFKKENNDIKEIIKK